MFENHINNYYLQNVILKVKLFLYFKIRIMSLKIQNYIRYEKQIKVKMLWVDIDIIVQK